MERITLVYRTLRKEGSIRLRFRLRDGRNVQLYYRSTIEVDIKRLDKLLTKLDDNLNVRKQVKDWDKELLQMLQQQKTIILETYTRMKNQGKPLTSENLEKEMNRDYLDLVEENHSLLFVMSDMTEKQYQDGVIGKSRYKHSVIVSKILYRFLFIRNKLRIKPEEMNPDLLMDFRSFLFDEYKYVSEYPELYETMKKSNIPPKRRGNNTVVTALNRLQSVFSELEDKDMIVKSPFRRLGKERRKRVMRERYDEPISLTQQEFLKILKVDLPPDLEMARKAFLLQCAIGCRISDFKSLTMSNLSVSAEGIPYIHYLPQKTLSSQMDYKEIQTPLVLFAVQIIKEFGFMFPIINRNSGENSYNRQIRKILQFCEIDRECTVFNEEANKNDYLPLYQLGGSKLCRKTHINLLTKVQVNKYAAGLHKEGSAAVDRYTCLDLSDRFVLLTAAFCQRLFRVDLQLNISMV